MQDLRSLVGVSFALSSATLYLYYVMGHCTGPGPYILSDPVTPVRGNPKTVDKLRWPGTPRPL
jgi:hypothetical protein